ncbi:DUF3301 domain-containing protein [Aliidiomarina sp. Khilg15.8]
MFDLSSVLLLALIAVIAMLFWQWRQQNEFAHAHAARYCKQEGLQLLDIARIRGRLVWTKRGLAWRADFILGFSSDGQSRYEGTLRLLNLRLQGIDMPVFREPTNTSAEPKNYHEPSSYH